MVNFAKGFSFEALQDSTDTRIKADQPHRSRFAQFIEKQPTG